MFEMTVNLLDVECSACHTVLGLSHEQVGFVGQDGKMYVWHLACAPVELRAAEAARV